MLLDSIDWLGHSGFRISVGRSVVYIDPYRVPENAPQADLILITHGHYDHFSPQDVERLSKRDTWLVGPAAVAERVSGQVHRIAPGEMLDDELVRGFHVSLGLYADAVQREGYRGAKLRTILDTVPEVLGPDAAGLDLRWTGPGGHAHRSGAAILVSNNRYRLGRAVASATRPRIDDGLLGITVAGGVTGRGHDGRRPQRPWRGWTAPHFEVDADHPVPAGIDGEAAQLAPPLRFIIRAGVLRVRIAHRHPGASPSANLPEGLGQSARALGRIAAGREPQPKTAQALTTTSHQPEQER